MAVELKDHLEILRRAGYVKGADKIEKVVDKMLRKNLIPENMQLVNENQAAELTSKISQAFPDGIEDDIEIRDLIRERDKSGKLVPLFDEEDKYPKWSKCLEGLNKKDLSALSSSLHRAGSGIFELKEKGDKSPSTIGDLRRLQPSDIKNMRGIGPYKAAILIRLFLK